MPQYRFSHRAYSDLQDINSYTLENWGQEQALTYIDGLELAAKSLASTPKVGKSCDDLRRGLRSYPYQGHILYFMEEKKGVVIIRVLHKRMSSELHI